jgi:hypothetical protein
MNNSVTNQKALEAAGTNRPLMTCMMHIELDPEVIKRRKEKKEKQAAEKKAKETPIDFWAIVNPAVNKPR